MLLKCYIDKSIFRGDFFGGKIKKSNGVFGSDEIR